MSMNFGPEWMRKKIPTSYDAGTNLSNINNTSMDNYSKGKTVMNDHKAAGSNQYKYSKDEVMSIWNNKKKPNNKKMSFDYDKNISSTEPLHSNPMTMMTFNNYDKKILGQNSVNNDMTSRSSRDFSDRSDNHFKDRNDARINSRPFSYNRGSYDQITNGRNDFTMDTNKKIGNIWESQNRSNNYMANNNMYSLKNKNDINKKPKYKSMSTPLDKDMEMETVQTNNMEKLNMKDNSNDLSSTFDNMSLKTNYGNDKSLNNSLFNNDIFSPFKSNSLNVTKTQSFDDSMKKTLNVNKLDNNGLQGNIFTEPDAIKEISKEIIIEPPKWNYKDPTGKIQGPFLYEEMQEWYNAGYFEKTLPIKKENDVEFKSLASMIEQYGEEKPFIIDAEKYIKKEKELSLKANEISAVSAAVQPPIASTTTSSKPTIKPIQKTIPSSTHQTTLDANVSSPIGNKTLPMSSYSVSGGIGLGRGIGMKENNSFSNNLDSMYNSFNNNSINSPKVYSGRNASFPSMGNQYEPVGYPGINRLSTGMNNPQMMGIPGSQPWVPYNDPSLLGLKGMIGFNDIYSNQYYNYDLMNPDLNKSNFNQHFYYQQLMQQTQQFPPQYYQMMRQMPQNQIPLYNMFGQPINSIGMKPQMVSNPNIGSIQNEIIPPMNTTTTNNTQSIFSGNDVGQNGSQNTSNAMWNTTPQSQSNINTININTNKAEKSNKTDSIPNADNTNNNIEETEKQPLNNENLNNNKQEDITNDIPINEANTEKKDSTEEVKVSEPEENEEPETEIVNEETQEEIEDEEQLVEEVKKDNETENKEEEKEENIEEPVEEEKEVEESLIEEESQENNVEIKEETKEENKKPISPAPAPIKNHWKISNKTQRLSFKEIQEMEEKEKLEQLKKQQQEIKEKQEAAAKAAAEAENSIESSPVSHSEPTTVWGAPHNNIQKPTLRQIMQEEENNKKKQKDLQMKEAESKKTTKTTSHVVVNTTRSVWAGRPLTIIADSNSKVVTASSLNAAKKETVKKEIISSATNRSQQSQVSNSVSNTPTTAKSDNEWTPVGKVVKKSEPTQKVTKSSSKNDNSKKGPSDAFMKWCKNALRVSTSAGVNGNCFL